MVSASILIYSFEFKFERLAEWSFFTKSIITISNKIYSDFLISQSGLILHTRF